MYLTKRKYSRCFIQFIKLHRAYRCYKVSYSSYNLDDKKTTTALGTSPAKSGVNHPRRNVSHE